MSLLLLFYATQAAPAQPGFINLALAEGDLWPYLNATSPVDAIFWSQADIYQYFDDAGKRLARKSGAFIVYDQIDITAATGVASYSLPDRHINTLQADLAGLVLRPRNIQQLEALDNSWPTTAGDPQAFLEDTQGLKKILLYPIPTIAHNGQPVNLAMAETPTPITVAQAVVNAPQCLREYFTFYALAEARTKETNASMDEVGQWFRSLVDMMDGVITTLWTNGV